MVVEVVVLLLLLFALCLLSHNSFSRLVLWFFPLPKISGKVLEMQGNVSLNFTHREPNVLVGHISSKKLIGNRSICRSSPFEYFLHCGYLSNRVTMSSNPNSLSTLGSKYFPPIKFSDLYTSTSANCSRVKPRWTLVPLALGSTCGGGSGGSALAIVRLVLASS